MPAPPLTLVLGYGNSSYADDGLGTNAIAYLKAQESAADLPADLLLLDGGTAVFELVDHIERCDRLVVIDAAEMAAAPGTVRCFVGVDMDRQLGQARRTAHEVALRDVLDIARLEERLPGRRALIGVQPKSLDFKVGLSTEVERSLPIVRERLLHVIFHEWK
ncbi:MAG: hydrogenase maturation protease [Rhodospirillales bacterium]|nr:hydrogenase maturation protease [Rhodospirillales bacterium]